MLPVIISNRSFHVHAGGNVRLASAPSKSGTAFFTSGTADARGALCVLNIEENVVNPSLQLIDSPLKDVDSASVTAFCIGADGATLAMSEPSSGSVLISNVFDINQVQSMLPGNETLVQALAFDITTTRLLMGNDEGKVQICEAGDLEKVIHIWKIVGPVTSATWAPSGALAVVATAGGQVHVLDTTNGDLRASLSAMTDAEAAIQPPLLCWSPGGEYLAVSRARSISIVTVPASETGWDAAWSIATSLPGSGSVTAITWSASSRYLAVALLPRTLTVWDIHSTSLSAVLGGGVAEVMEGEDAIQPVAGVLSTTSITGLAWSRDGATLVFVDASGHACGVRTRSLAGAAALLPSPDVPATLDADDAEGMPASQEAVDLPDSSSATSSGLEKQAPRTSYAEAEAEESKSVKDDDGMDVSLAAEKHKLGFADGDGEKDGGRIRRINDGDDGDKGAAPEVDMEQVGSMIDRRMADAVEEAAHIATAHIEEVYGLVLPQSAFQPGSTHFKDSAAGRGAPKRYLQWNAVGSITARQDAMSTSIDVEFTESTRFSAKHFDDDLGFTLAALNTHGAVFASKYKPPAGPGDKCHPAQILYKVFGSGLSAGLEWTLALPVSDGRMQDSEFPKRMVSNASKGKKVDVDAGEDSNLYKEAVYELNTSAAAESPVSLGLGDGWIAVGTDRRCLHFLRTSGAEEGVVKLPGDIVAVAASGTLCAVVYHRALPMGGCQQQCVRIYRVPAMSMPALNAGAGQLPQSSSLPIKLETVDLPLSAGHTLQWLGFSATGVLCAHSSGGELWCLQPATGWEWWSVADTHQLALEAGGVSSAKSGASVKVAYWPLSVELAPPSAIDGALDGSTIAHGTTRVPVLAAVFCRGGQLEPPVSSPRPLTTLIQLHAPLWGLNNAFDNAVIGSEMVRLQRAWCIQQGLLPDQSGTSMQLHTVNAAASMALRGDTSSVVDDVHETFDAFDTADYNDCAAVDKATIRMIKVACDKGTAPADARAMQFLTRLHLTKSFEVASKVASQGSRTAVAERAMQFMLLKRAEDEGSFSASGSHAAPAPRPAHSSVSASTSADSHGRVQEQAPSRGFGLVPRENGVNPGPARPAATLDMLSKDKSEAGVGVRSGSGGTNPFAKRSTSPSQLGKRKAGGLEVLGLASPERASQSQLPKTHAKPAQGMQSSMSEESRSKRAKGVAMGQ